jgi:hypothetical protein
MPRSICKGLTSPGCFVCRARKVKCDERWPTCTNCERLNLDCSGRPGQGGLAARAQRNARRDSTLTQAGTTRHRVSKSCYACRLAKSRCSGGETCTRCARREIHCSYAIGSMQKPQGSQVVSERRQSLRESPNSNDVQSQFRENNIHLQLSAESTSGSTSW